MRQYSLILLFLFSCTHFVYSQETYDVTIKLKIDTTAEQLPNTLPFFPTNVVRDSTNEVYTASNLTTGDYYLHFSIVNYEILDTLIHVGKDISNKHTIHLKRIPIPYSFSSDLKNDELRLFIETQGPVIFYGSKVSEKMKSKFNVTITSSNISCFDNNTNYDLEYSRRVTDYLDEKYGNRWRRYLKRYNLIPWE